MAAVALAWLGLGRGLERVSLAELRAIGALWCAPLLLAPALFSRDVYSYLAQGAILHLGLSPYHHAPAVLGQLGHGHLLSAVSPFWRLTTAPYGPLFLAPVSLLANAGLHLSVVLLRLAEVVAVALLAYLAPRLARALGGDPARALWLVALSPLVLFELIVPAHNDALMVALMLGGVTLAVERRPLAGIVVCALAAAVKLPAAAAIPFIAVAWARTQPTAGARAAVLARAAAAVLVVALLVSAIPGIGFSWLSSSLFSTPQKVRLAITPATALGWTGAALLRDAGVAVSARGLEATLGVLAFCAVGVGAVVLLARTRLERLPRDLGWLLLAAAFGGPAAWPWYFIWGLALLACCPGVLRARPVVLLVALSVFLVKANGVLALPLQSAPAVLAVYAAGALVCLAARPRSPPRRARAPALGARRVMTATAERATVREPGRAASRRDWAAVAALAAPTALAAVLVAVGLSARSLGFDEAASVTIAAQHGHALWRAIAHDGGNMSGYYLLLHVVIGLFGRSLVVVRLPSAIAAVATVALLARIGLRLFDRRVALFAGLLCAVSLPLVFWGQSARGYAPMVALVSASWLSFASRRRVLYVIATVLAVYMSFVAVLAVAAQLVVWRRRDVRPLLACAVGWVPLVVLALARGSGQLFWVPRPNATSIWQVLQTLASAGLPPSFHTSAIAIPLTILTVAVIAAVRRPATRLPLAWLLVPLGLALVESLVGQSIFVPRNLLVCLPPVALLLAVALTHPRVPRHAAWVAVALLIALRAVPLVQSYGVSPENWKAATAYVRERARPSDCIAFYPSDARMPFAYYGRAARPVLPADPWGPLRVYVEDYAARPAPASCPRLWLVSSHEGQLDGPAQSRANFARFIALRSSLRRAYGGSERDARFGYAAVITVELLSRP